MNIENRPAIITDSSTSIHPHSQEAEKLGINIVPFTVNFLIDKQWTPFRSDELPAKDFYQMMKDSPTLPKTSGSLTGELTEKYSQLLATTNQIVSIHVTSEHSVAYRSAILAAELVSESRPKNTINIEVIDSRNVSLGAWFLVEQAAKLANQGINLEDIKKITLETIPKVKLITALNTVENAVKGGRLPALAGHLSSLFQIKPIVDIIDGKLTVTEKVRTTTKARQRLITKVTDTKPEIIKLAVIHTNDPEGAEEIKNEIAKFYHSPISIYEAGPAIATHAGEGAISIAFQTK